MTLFMAGEEQLVFHDFLGIIGTREDTKQGRHCSEVFKGTRNESRVVKETEGDEGSTRASSMNSGRFEASSDHVSWSKAASAQDLGSKSTFNKSADDNRQGKRRDITNSREYLQERAQMEIETLDSSRLLKVSRLERQDDRKNRHLNMAVDDLLVMQPPRMSAKGANVHPSTVVKGDLPTIIPRKWDSSRIAPSTGLPGTNRTSQLGHSGVNTEKVAASMLREKASMPPLPPADEGSRTGLKGSSVANLLNNSSSNHMKGVACPNPPLTRSKSLCQTAGPDSTFVPSQLTAARASRQLTIFYGGQAHVFDDVPSDKADAIMTLAGSSGRSWSTMYTSRSKTSLPLSASEGSMSVLDREREKSASASKSGAMNGFSSLALSSEAHNSISNSGHGGQENNYRDQEASKFDYTGFSPQKQDSIERLEVHATTGAGEAGKGLL